MTLKMPQVEVWLAPDPAEPGPPDHVLVIATGDQLRGELEGLRLKLPAQSDAPMNAMCLWLWACMARQGLTDLKAAAFLAAPPEFQPVKELAPVGPTSAQPGQPD